MKINSPIIVFGMAVAAIATHATSANAISLFINNRSEFNNSLNRNVSSTITDDGIGLFGTALAPQTGLAKVTRTGLINGSSFSYNIYDVNFSNKPTNKLTPGVAGDDILSLSTLAIEAPASQDSVKGNAKWGVDSQGTVDNGTTRNAALFDFTTTPNNAGIGHFGVDLHDFESDPNFTSAELRLYKGGVLTSKTYINWGNGLNGDKESNFLGVVADNTNEFFDQVVVVLGDDNPGQGFTEAWAADNFKFGQAYHEEKKIVVEIPEPSTVTGILALLGLGAFCRKQKKNS